MSGTALIAGYPWSWSECPLEARDDAFWRKQAREQARETSKCTGNDLMGADIPKHLSLPNARQGCRHFPTLSALPLYPNKR